ncbi:histidine kinase [Saprospiraceae bacterium]|nr:histidine kinase [Saprospiraceae bacterium]
MQKFGVHIVLLLICFFAKAQTNIPPLPPCTLNESPEINYDSLLTYSLDQLICFSQYALNSSIKNSNLQLLISSLDDKRKAYTDLADFENIIRTTKTQANLWYSIDSLEKYAHSLLSASNAEYRIGNYYSCFELSNKALTIGRKYRNDSLEAVAIKRISWTQWSIHRYEDAIKSTLAYQEVCKKGNLSQSFRYPYLNARARFAEAIGNLEEARLFGDSLINMALKNKNKYWLNFGYSNMTMYYEGNDDMEHRLWLVNEAIKINHERNDEEQLGSNLGLTGFLYAKDEQYDLAIEYFNKSLVHSTALGDRRRMYDVYIGLSSTYDSLHMYKEALEYSKKEKELHKQLFGDDNLKRVFDLEQINAEQEFQRLKSEEEINELILARKNMNLALAVILLLAVIATAMWVFRHNKTKQTAKQLALKLEYENQIKTHEMQSLRAQMNPHFIFNSLNSIKGYITTNESRIAAKYLTKFSKLIRLILNHSRLSKISLAEELESLELYIDLEQLRLENSFTYTIKSTTTIDLEKISIPPMIIQPYVENAIWHGLVHKEGMKYLQINIDQSDKIIAISIMDNGVGRKASQEINAEKKKLHKSHGMNITKKRIELINKSSDFESVKVSDLYDQHGKPTGTNVLINLTKNHQLWED